MRRYFNLTLKAQLRSGLSLYLLTVFGVALGVASVLSIQIINRNALAAFEGSMTAVSGTADLSVLGNTPPFSEALYPAVLSTPGISASWPLLRTAVALETDASMFLDLVGVDFFTPMGIPWEGEPGDLSQALSQPGWVAITPTLAERMGWAIGDALTVLHGSSRAHLVIGALVDFQARSPLASPKLAVMDIAQAQGLFGRSGRIDQIDIQLTDDADLGAVQAQLQAQLGDSVRVVKPEQRERQAAGLLSAFRLNLTALSLISLFVGMFLVYSSTQASLVRRREEFGLLRSLGATRGQVFGLIMCEVGSLGILGVIIGLPLGYGVAQANVHLVSATLTNLYLLDEISRLQMTGWLYALGVLIGVGGALAGALLPALDMSRKDTRSLLSAFTLHETVGNLAPRLFILGLGLMVAALAWYGLLGRHWQHAGFVLGIILLIAIPLMTPILIRAICCRLRVNRFGMRYSLKGLGARLQTTSVAVAALAVSVSMLMGITLMIGSFRQTLNVWIGTSIQADVYIAPKSWGGKGSMGGMAPDVIASLVEHPAVQSVDQLRRFSGYTGDQRIGIAGAEMELTSGEARFPLLPGSAPDAYQRVRTQGAIFIGETIARKLNVWGGDVLPIYTPTGIKPFPIAAVYYDYSTDGGAVMMDLRTLTAAFGPGPIHALALYLKPGSDPERVVDALKAIQPNAPLEIRSNRRLREEVLSIFDQTFAVTRLLQLMSLLISVSGIALMLLVLAREQVSELALYQALGAQRRQIFSVFVGSGLSMGAMGLALGSAGGVLLAGVLIYVINRAYFGWTIQPYVSWGPLVQQAATILAAALLASLYPAFRASQTPSSELSRDPF